MAEVAKELIVPQTITNKVEERIPAHKLLDKFLAENHIVLSYKYSELKTVSDGGIFIDAPILVVNYTD